MRAIVRICMVLLLLTRAQVAFSQDARDRVEALRMSYINEHVGLTNAEAEKFWPVYNEYNDKIRAIRRNLRQSYKHMPENLSDQEAEQLNTLFVQSKQAEADVHRQYNEKLKAIIGAKKLVKLRVAEEEFRIKVMKSIKGEGD